MTTTSRREFLAAIAGALVLPRIEFGARPHPTAAQLEWQRDELAMFVHFGMNTFTDREWGDGQEDPALFAPTDLDARQWARTAKEAGDLHDELHAMDYLVYAYLQSGHDEDAAQMAHARYIELGTSYARRFAAR